MADLSRHANVYHGIAPLGKSFFQNQGRIDDDGGGMFRPGGFHLVPHPGEDPRVDDPLQGLAAAGIVENRPAEALPVHLAA